MESLNKPFRRRVTVFVGVTLVDVPQKKNMSGFFFMFFPTTFSGAESRPFKSHHFEAKSEVMS